MNGTISRIAWRNLWRHPQRTILMIATVAVGSLVILILFGLTDGVVGSMTATQVDWNQGDFQVRTQAYAEDPLSEHALTPSQISTALEALSGIEAEAIALRMETAGMVRSAYGTDGIMIRGIDPLNEAGATSLDQIVVKGEYLGNTGQVLLSTALAENLDIRLGEKVVLLAIGAEGTDSRAFRVAGLFQPPMTDLEQTAMITLEDARSMTGMEGATSLAFALPQGTSTHRTVERARELLASQPGIAVADYFDLNPFARFMISGSTIKMIPFVVMISLMAGFGVANTTFYSVLERTREFGVMTAVGMSRKLLSRMVLIESIMVAAIGFVSGGGLGYLGLFYLSRNGWDISFVTDMVGSIGFPRVIYASTSGWYWLAALSVVVFTALTAAWYPARRVNRLEPVTAIREG